MAVKAMTHSCTGLIASTCSIDCPFLNLYLIPRKVRIEPAQLATVVSIFFFSLKRSTGMAQKYQVSAIRSRNTIRANIEIGHVHPLLLRSGTANLTLDSFSPFRSLGLSLLQMSPHTIMSCHYSLRLAPSKLGGEASGP